MIEPGRRLRRWGHLLGSVRLRLLVLVALAALPPVGIAIWQQGRIAQQRLQEAGAGMAELARNAAREQAALIGQVEILLASMARLPPLRESSPEACGAMLPSIAAGAPWLYSLGIYAPDGRTICSTLVGGREAGIGDRPYFRAALERRRFVLSDLVVGRVLPLPMVMAAMPVLDDAGRVRRVIAAGIDLARLGDPGRPALPGTADVLLIADAAGQVAARHPPAAESIGRSLRGGELDAALLGRAGHLRATGADGEARVYGFAPVPGSQAMLILGRREAAILAPVHALRAQVLALAAGAAALAILAALAFGRWMLLRPVMQLGDAVRRIAEGRLDARAPVAPLGGELADLAREVNRMAARLACGREALQTKNAELAGLAAQLTAARDAAEAASAAKSRFVAMVSHELRTPLNGIFGHMQLLLRDPELTPIQRRGAETITASAEHLLSVIRDLLDLSAIEAGRITLLPGPVRLAALAESCAGLVRPAAEAKGLDFAVELAALPSPWVAADAMRLRQVLLNLLGNAVKFTARGRVVLRIRPGTGERTRFEVADTGPGLTAAEQATLFREFSRLPGADRAEGSGLGLAITARLVALMGGEVGCDSVAGQGSTFWAELPLPPAAPPEPEARPAPLTAGRLRLRLLVADDVAANREVVRALLSAAGHEVHVVENGALAVEAALGADWDAVLLDLHMPVLDGKSAARRIRAAPGPRGRVPIVAVTASAGPEEVADCLAAGMDAHIEKPIRMRLLWDILARIRADHAPPAPALR